MTWLQEELTVEVTAGEAVLAESRGSVRREPGMCSFCSPRVVKSA